MSAPEFITISNIIVDDIVLADGRSFMNTLGGAGTHTLIGMRPWSEKLGFVAYRGDDFDPAHAQFLTEMSVDQRGIVHRPGHRTARAWQLFEPDERRIEIFRTSIDDFFECRAQLSEIPADYALARGVHLSWSPLEETAAMIDWLRSHNPQVRLVSEPALSALDLPLSDHLPVLTQLDLLSPDREEARALTGAETITGMFEVLLTNGVPMVALRMGALGSIIGTAAGEFYQVPAVPPAELVDVTGAGNAYCGGFTVGIGRGEETALAAARAAASASFALEQIGVPSFDETKIAEARRRLSWALERIRSAQSLASLLPPGLH